MSTLQQSDVMELHRRPTGGVVVTQIVWQGVDEFSRFLRETPGVVVKDVEAALFQEGENVMGVSVRNTPVDTGFLWAGGHNKKTGETGPKPWRDPPITKGGVTTVTLAYGASYAVFAHEQPARAGGQGGPKFLENAVKGASKGFGDRMQKRVLDRIKRRR